MRKLRLAVEELAVESFEVRGEVHGNDSDVTGILICGVEGDGSLNPPCGGDGSAGPTCDQTCPATCGMKVTCFQTCPPTCGMQSTCVPCDPP